MRFFSNKFGSVAPIFAAVLPGLAMVIFGMTDYSRAASVRGTVQDALDAAALAAATQPGLDNTAMSELAQKFVDANLGTRFSGVTVTVSVSTDANDVVNAHANVSVQTIAGGVVGRSTIDYSVKSQVKAAVQSRLEMSLVLDTTGSMQGSKIATLKTAATDLVDTIMDGELVSVSVVPFARYVHVGMSHRNHPGIDVPNDEPGERQCDTVNKTEKYNCRNVPSTCWNDGVSRPCTKRKCETRVVGTRERCRTVGKKTWRGCVGSRRSPRHLDLEFYQTEVPGLLNVNCNNPVTRLTTNATTVRSAINALKTGHDTYIAPGMIWGWRTLSPNYPFPDGTDPSTLTDEEVIRAMVLMTDGANTRARSGNSGWHNSGNGNDADDVMVALCENIKDDDIELFTIAFEVDDANIKRLLRDCASDPDKHFDARNADMLKSAFEEVARELMELHISR